MDMRQLLAQSGKGSLDKVEAGEQIPDGYLMSSYHPVNLSLLKLQSLHSLGLLLE